MSEYTEKRIVVEDVPVVRRPVVETHYDSVVTERRGMSGVAIAALIVAAVTAAVVITMMIINGQQRTSDQELAQERARTDAAQQTPAQPASQQPVIVTVPSQPAVVPVPYPVPGPSQPAPSDARTAPSAASVEIEVAALLQKDDQLRSFAIEVKVSGGTAILSGAVTDEDLKTRAGKLARGVNGVQNVINDIAVRR